MKRLASISLALSKGEFSKIPLRSRLNDTKGPYKFQGFRLAWAHPQAYNNKLIHIPTNNHPRRQIHPVPSLPTLVLCYVTTFPPPQLTGSLTRTALYKLSEEAARVFVYVLRVLKVPFPVPAKVNFQYASPYGVLKKHQHFK